MVESLPSYCSTTDLFSGKRTLRTICELILAIKTTNGLSKNIARNSSNLSQNFANDSDFEVVRKVFCSSLAIDIFCWCLSKFHHRFSECIFCFDDTYSRGGIFQLYFVFRFWFSLLNFSASDFQWEDEKLTTTVDFIIAFCDLVIRRKSRWWTSWRACGDTSIHHGSTCMTSNQTTIDS